MQQLDIFADSRDRVLLNLLAEALAQHDLSASRAAADALRNAYPNDRHLGAAAALIEALASEAAAGKTPLPDATAALSARLAIAQTQRPAAVDLLGSETAAAWLAHRWRALACRATALPYDTATASAHAASLWLQAQAWAEAVAAVETIASWRRRPQPLAWMAEAIWHLRGADSAWPLLAELAWMAPTRLPPLLAQLPDPGLHKLARRFEGALDGQAAWAWWPAWLLVDQPLLAAVLQDAQPGADTPPERGFRLLLSLLRLERLGRHHDIVALRQALKALHPGLFAAYMALR